VSAGLKPAGGYWELGGVIGKRAEVSKLEMRGRLAVD